MDTHDALSALFNAGIAVSIIATVLSLGLSFTIGQVIAPLRHVGLILALVVLNVVVIPTGAWGIAEAAGLSADQVSGIALAAVGSAGAAGLKAAQLAKRADLALAVSSVVVLQVLNLIAVPFWAGQVVAGATISAATILQDLLLLVLLPLIFGMIARARYAEHAERWQAELVRGANLALAIALVSGIAVNWQAIVDLLGSRALIVSATIVVVAVGLGMLIGGRDPGTRITTGLISGLRFGSLGLIIIGTQLGGNPTMLGCAIVFSLIDMVLVVGFALESGRRAAARTVGES